MTWKVIGCFQRDFIPLCISRVSGFTIKRHGSFMKAHIVNWGGEGNSHKSPISELSCILWLVFFSQKELLELRRPGRANTCSRGPAVFSSSSVPLPSPKVSCAPLPPCPISQLPRGFSPGASADFSAEQEQGSGPGAGVSPERFGAQLCQRLHMTRWCLWITYRSGKRGDVGKGVTPSPHVVVSPW